MSRKTKVLSRILNIASLLICPFGVFFFFLLGPYYGFIASVMYMIVFGILLNVTLNSMADDHFVLFYELGNDDEDEEEEEEEDYVQGHA